MKSAETPAYLCSHIFERTRPVLLVSRSEGDWQFLCGDTHPQEDVPHVVGVNHLFEDDPSLAELADLPPDWEAERDSAASPWRRLRIAD